MNINIIRKNVKNITIRVKSDGTVNMTVPLNTQEKDIDAILRKRMLWIKKQVEYFKENYVNESEKKYLSGETFSYLGKNYELKVIESPKSNVDLAGNFLRIYTPQPLNIEYTKKLLKRWYTAQARAEFNEIINHYLYILNETIEKFTIRTMKSRWGSCNFTRKTINLNLKLVEKPRTCIEYVILHELAHLKHPNHSKDFYKYISLFMPDYKQRKRLLYGKIK